MAKFPKITAPRATPAGLFCTLLALVLSTILCCGHAQAAQTQATRERLSLDEGWRFALGHAQNLDKDFQHGTSYFSYLSKAGFGDGPAKPDFDDHTWRVVNVPHDWAVELPFEPSASPSHGYKPLGLRFPETSIGWYRKTFHVPESDLGRKISLQFDGIYRDARIFVNGFLLGQEPSGYLGVSYDITDYLNYGGDNTIAVRADASMEEGWFYEGAGIYRHVWMTKTNPLHLEKEGLWVRTEGLGEASTVRIDTEIVNAGRCAATFQLKQRVLSPSSLLLAELPPQTIQLEAGQTITVTQEQLLKQPELWSLENPVLHTLVSTLERDGQLIDTLNTRFGVRSIRWDPNEGFFLNEKHVKIKGTNNHQDHAGLGVALPDAMQDFRIKRLKEMGSNTYRASHNPPTPEFLDACDRLGMLVIDETRLMGINEMHLDAVRRMIRSDRNHPSVILWSLGNEEWGLEGNIKGARVATTMQDFAKRLDPTRPATIAISGGWGGISTVIDVMGVNYIKHGDTDRQHAQYPWQVILGTEETTTQATRGIYVEDRDACHLPPQENGSSGGNAELGWQHYASRPYTAGVIYWTGFDYRGEATPFGYPAISSQFGILDTCGFPKDGFYYLKAWWGTEPVLHVLPHWNWPGREGQAIDVTVFSNCDEVELLLNGQSLGRQSMEVNKHLEWKITYTPGTLKAIGYKAGTAAMETRVETTGPAKALQLTPDRITIQADGRDVSVISVSTLDAQGRPVPTQNSLVHFEIEGPGKIIGVGNGDPSCLEADTYVSENASTAVSQWKRSTFNGLAQVIVQSTGEVGTIRLKATAESLLDCTLVLNTTATTTAAH